MASIELNIGTAIDITVTSATGILCNEQKNNKLPINPDNEDEYSIENEYYIAIGNPVYDYIDNNIVVYPIYLIQNEYVYQQIGVYEILSVIPLFKIAIG